MEPLLTPASREAEIAARLEARQNEWRFYSEDMGEDCRYLLAQLQQAQQELDALDGKLTFNEQGYRLVQAQFEAAERRAETAEAALQQAREALEKYGRHSGDCARWPSARSSGCTCTCGLDAALHPDTGREQCTCAMNADGSDDLPYDADCAVHGDTGREKEQ